MALTLGQKLRQAREDKGISVGEVAEHTRIAPLYIESIDNDDYRALPGGIFNRGFIKSYAKFVGVSEQEALADYTRLLNETEGNDVEEVNTYRPQVLTDDRSTTSMIPTLIVAVIFLGLMTGGVLFLVNYLRQPTDEAAVTPSANTSSTTSTSNSAAQPEPTGETTPSAVPDMATLKIEFKAISQPVALMVVNDGKTSNNTLTPGSTTVFEPKENVKVSYSRSMAQYVQLTVNGKTISLPEAPLNPKRPVIEFEIDKNNLAQIWASGAISGERQSAAANANLATKSSPSGTPKANTSNSKTTPSANVRPSNIIRPAGN